MGTPAKLFNLAAPFNKQITTYPITKKPVFWPRTSVNTSGEEEQEVPTTCSGFKDRINALISTVLVVVFQCCDSVLHFPMTFET